MKKSAVIISVILVAALAVGAYAYVKNKDKNAKSNTPVSSQNTNSTTQTQNTEQQASNENASATTITYTDSGFSPDTITVKSGTTVTIKNDSSSVLQFQSDPHPTHTDDTELNVGTIAPGKSTTITVHKTGDHGYHNHLNTSDTGTIVVQ